MDEDQKKMADELLFAGKKKTSFAKQLYFGVLDTSEVFPYPQVSDQERKETDAYVDQIEKFAQEYMDADKIDRNAEIPQEVIEGLGKLGVLSMSIPKKFGGLGLSQYAYCRAMETIAKNCGSTSLFVNAHQSVGMKALVLFGTEAQQNKWLKSLATGEIIAAFSLTEPNAGSDAAGIETTAVFDPAKNVYRITGNKQWTTNGSIAKILTVMAKVDGKVTAFLVTPDMPGFSVTAPALEKVGFRGSKTANLRYENVEVPPENILGPLGGGLRVCLTVLDYGRITFGATCTGVAKDLVKRAIKHSIERHQFKRPLATFGLVKDKIAKMAAYLYAMESTTYLTAGLVDKGVEDVMLESAILKVFNSDSLWNILYDTMQIFGGRSFFTTLPLERIMRDARINLVGEGSNEVLRVFIGLVGMRDVGMELKDFVDGKNRWTIAQQMFKRRFIRSKIEGKFKEEALQLDADVRRFGIAVLKVLAKYREKVDEHQLPVNRIATSAIALYTSTAVLGRLNLGANEQDLAAGKLYLRIAHETLHKELDHLFDPLDEEITKVSDKLTGVHYP